MKRIFKFLVVPMLVVMLLMATAVPIFADAGPPGPPDTTELPNEDPAANDTGHDASCDAQGATLGSDPGATADTPPQDALETNHEVQCGG